VRVSGGRRGARLERDDWVEVTGVLTRGHREWIVNAVRIEHVQRPADPYLSFAG
jgi:hypothetical protein